MLIALRNDLHQPHFNVNGCLPCRQAGAIANAKDVSVDTYRRLSEGDV